MRSLVRNHPPFGGDERLGRVAARLAYRPNGHGPRAPDVDRGEAFVLAVARGDLDLDEIADTPASWVSERLPGTEENARKP